MYNSKCLIAGKAGLGCLLSLLRLVLVGSVAFGATPTVLASSANARVARDEYRDFSLPLNLASVHSGYPAEFVTVPIEADPFWTVSRVAWVMGAITAIVLLASFSWRYHSVARLNSRLSRQAAILRAVLDNVDQGISLFDGDLKSVAFNDRFIELLDLPLELDETDVPYEEYLRCIADRGEYGPGDADNYIRERMKLAWQFKSRQFVRQRPDGATIDIRRNPIPEGGFVTTYTDITDRMRVEDALRFSEQQLSEAQRIGRIGHWRYFPVLNKFECSEAFYQIYGWELEREKATFSAITSAVHPEDKERVNATRKNAGMRREAFVCEFRILRPDGEIRFIKGEGRPEFDDKGQLVSFFGVNQDITEQKRAEQELLRERTRAEMANLAKSEFLANMSHEIRTPLNAIIGFADIMNQKVFGPVGNARYTDYVSDIHSSARHLLDLVNDILDISTIEAGELTLSPTELNIAEIFEECTRFVREQAREAEYATEQ
jgi:PAS domain S-box-containing protein